MRIKSNGTILENDNPLVVEQWKKAGYTDIDSAKKKSKKGKEASEEVEEAVEVDKEPPEEESQLPE